MTASHVISNQPQDFQLLNLAPERGHPEARGPYMISQEGAAPGDLVSRHCAFVLTRRGTWLHHFILFHLAADARSRLVEFPTAGEALAFARELTGDPRVETLDSVTAWLRELGHADALDVAGVAAERARLQAQHARD
jgi:hypothetical protein